MKAFDPIPGHHDRPIARQKLLNNMEAVGSNLYTLVFCVRFVICVLALLNIRCI